MLTSVPISCGRPAAERPAVAAVEALGALADHDEVDLAAAHDGVGQRRRHAGEQPARAQVHVVVEGEAQLEQQAALEQAARHVLRARATRRRRRAGSRRRWPARPWSRRTAPRPCAASARRPGRTVWSRRRPGRRRPPAPSRPRRRPRGRCRRPRSRPASSASPAHRSGARPARGSRRPASRPLSQHPSPSPESEPVSLPFDLRPNPHPRSAEERAAILADPGFGNHFTDHMAVATWTSADGWQDSAIVPYGPFTLDPATAVLHYAQEIFEGLKAYRHADGSVWGFRPDQNAARLRRSARRMALPELSEEDFLASIDALVAADEAWVPTRRERHRRADRERRAEPVPAPVPVRLGGVPRRAAVAARDLLLHRQPGGPLLRERRAPGPDLGLHHLQPLGPRRHRCGQDRRQLRVQPRRAGRGGREGLRPGDVHRRGRAALGRGAGRHERLPRHHRQRARHPGAQRDHPRGRHPRLDPDPGDRVRAHARSSGRSRWRSCSRASTPASSPRSSPAGPPRSSPRSGCSPTTAATTRSPRGRPARSPPRSARTCSTSSTAAPRTPTAGCAASSDAGRRHDPPVFRRSIAERGPIGAIGRHERRKTGGSHLSRKPRVPPASHRGTMPSWTR